MTVAEIDALVDRLHKRILELRRERAALLPQQNKRRREINGEIMHLVGGIQSTQWKKSATRGLKIEDVHARPAVPEVAGAAVNAVDLLDQAEALSAEAIAILSDALLVGPLTVGAGTAQEHRTGDYTRDRSHRGMGGGACGLRPA